MTSTSFSRKGDGLTGRQPQRHVPKEEPLPTRVSRIQAGTGCERAPLVHNKGEVSANWSHWTLLQPKSEGCRGVRFPSFTPIPVLARPAGSRSSANSWHHLSSSRS